MLINYIKRKVLGYSLPQEYACLALQEFEGPLRVVLTVKGSTDFLDVSDSHLFLGYKPLVIGITLQLSSNFPLSEYEEILPDTLFRGIQIKYKMERFPFFRPKSRKDYL